MLDITDLICGYGRNSAPVISGLSLSFRPNVLTALIGPNGCGKSTLLKSIMGFLNSDSGEITLRGRPISSFKRRELARYIAYLPQESHCPDYLTLGELVELGGFARQSILGGVSTEDRKRFAEALDLVGLRNMAHKQVNRLSGGQRQRAWIAMILAQDADVILMDEPVNHLDIKFQYSVMDLARSLMLSQGKTVVSVLHDINLASMYADDVVILKEGSLVANGPCHEVVTSENIREAFDFNAEIFRSGDRLICAPNVSGLTAAAE